MSDWWRILRHRWRDSGDSRRAVPDAMAARLEQKILESEQRHTGEIRICIEAALPTSYLRRVNAETPLAQVIHQRALAWFGRLRIWDTEANNGLLIYLQLTEHRIEIVADRGLAKQVEATCWRTMVDDLSHALREGEIEAGLERALEVATALLVAHFPLEKGGLDRNELPDTVIRV